MGIVSAPSYRREMTAHVRPVGVLLREWRQRRGLSQLDFACEADVSARHLSFVGTGRSVPSREMILHLAERLESAEEYAEVDRQDVSRSRRNVDRGAR